MPCENLLVKESDRPPGERLSLFDRPRTADDSPPDVIPSVKRWLQRLANPSSARLAYADEERSIFLAPLLLDGVDHIQTLTRMSNSGGGTRFPRSQLNDSGAGGITYWEDPDHIIVVGVIPDEIETVSVDSVAARVSSNLFIAEMESPPHTITLRTPTGERQIQLGEDPS